MRRPADDAIAHVVAHGDSLVGEGLGVEGAGQPFQRIG